VREAAGNLAGVLWVDLEASAFVHKVLVVVLKQGMGLLSSLSMTLTVLMEAVQVSSVVMQ